MILNQIVIILAEPMTKLILTSVTYAVVLILEIIITDSHNTTSQVFIEVSMIMTLAEKISQKVSEGS